MKGFKLFRNLLGIVLGLIFLFPIYILLINSFKTQKGIFTNVLSFPTAQFFTTDNYVNAFKQLDFLRSFLNSLLISVSATILIILLCSMAAWMLVRTKTKLSQIIFFTFALAMLIPFQCIMLPLVNLAGKVKLLNPIGLVIMYLGFGSSLSIILFHGFIKNVPLELEEAALLLTALYGHIA